MRILVTIPHYHRPDPSRALYGSCTAPGPRVAALTACLSFLHQTFGVSSRMVHSEHPIGGLAANAALSHNLDVMVCTTRDDHLLNQIPGNLFQHVPTTAEPMLLGFECHSLLRDNIGRYDWYVFMEDDNVITDTLLFDKLSWFLTLAGPNATLLPNRYERHPSRPGVKLYVDGQTQRPEVAAQFQDRNDRPEVTGELFGREWVFKRVDNPHSGAFFLNATQMEAFAAAPHFLDRATGFWSALDSAATLSLMRSFRVYKPGLRNAGFLEMLHAHNRELGTKKSMAPKS
jgi:hypothetical protein